MQSLEPRKSSMSYFFLFLCPWLLFAE
jgi:hypothetical protein